VIVPTVLVEGINIHTKHEKPNQRNQQGGLVKVELPVHYSNVKLVETK
jgi:large subunit ribosomal protein L24